MTQPKLPPRRTIGPLLYTAFAIVLTIVTGMTSCSRDPAQGYDYLRVTIGEQDAFGIIPKNKMIRGVVVFFHDVGANEFSLSSDKAHKIMTEKLVDAGFAVVSSRAGGDAFGNLDSQKNYIYLGGAAAEHLDTENVFFLAESMGALAAVNVMAMNLTSRIRGLAAINPMLDLSAVAPQYRSLTANSYANQSMDSANPVNLSLDALRGKKMRFYVSADDSLVRADANALAFRARFGAAVDISIAECSGPHGDPSCFQGDDIVNWFSQLERATP